MKNPGEYYNLLWRNKFPNMVLNSDFVEEVIDESIRLAQKDAYNDAMDFCFNSIEKMNAKFNRQED